MTKDEILIVRLHAYLQTTELEKEMRRVLREMEDGVVFLQPYEEPLLIPAGLEVRIEEAEL